MTSLRANVTTMLLIVVATISVALVAADSAMHVLALVSHALSVVRAS